jgi:hypothetical protein
MSAKSFVSCVAVALVACGGPQLRDEYGRIPRARSDAAAWVSSLAECSAPTGSDTRVQGTLAPTAGGVTTRLFCSVPGCCNTVTPYSFKIVGEGSSKLVDLSAASHAPDVFSRPGGTVYDCEWAAWREVLEATPVVVVGTLDGELLRVTEVCRPD